MDFHSSTSMTYDPLSGGLGVVLVARLHDDESHTGLRLTFSVSPFVADHLGVQRDSGFAVVSPVHHHGQPVIHGGELAVRGDLDADHGTNVRLERRLDLGTAGGSGRRAHGGSPDFAVPEPGIS